MTIKQRILKLTYPIWMRLNKLTGKSSRIMENENKQVNPVSSLYDLNITLNNGEVIPLSSYKGKKIHYLPYFPGSGRLSPGPGIYQNT